MIVGSWAEHLYPYYLGDEYIPNLKTLDVDIYYGNPYLEVSGAETLIDNFRTAGFIPDEHFIDTGKFFKEGLAVEFISSQMGSGPGMIALHALLNQLPDKQHKRIAEVAVANRLDLPQQK